MLRVERGTELFPFLAVWGGIFDALYAGRTFTLHGIRRYAAKPQKITRNRTPATRYRKSWNGVPHIRRRQILHESHKHWFWWLISSRFCPKISVNPVRTLVLPLTENPTSLKPSTGFPSPEKPTQTNTILSNYERIKYYPDKVSIYQSSADSLFVYRDKNRTDG